MGEKTNRLQLGKQRVELWWGLSQQALGVLSCDFQSTDPDRLALDLTCFAFGSPLNGQPGAKPIGDKTHPHLIEDSIWAPVIDRPDLHVTLQLTEGLFDGQFDELQT